MSLSVSIDTITITITIIIIIIIIIIVVIAGSVSVVVGTPILAVVGQPAARVYHLTVALGGVGGVQAVSLGARAEEGALRVDV